MNVLVDTSVWSLALRRRPGPVHGAVSALADLIGDGRVAIIGPIRQELLSGIRHQVDFERLRDHLRDFPDTALIPVDFERAAEQFNACRGRGIQGSNTDFLICAIAERTGYPILTTDDDFRTFAKVLAIQLYNPTGAAGQPNAFCQAVHAPRRSINQGAQRRAASVLPVSSSITR